MKLITRAAIYISFLLIVSACKKDNNKNDDFDIRIEGFDVFDSAGNLMAHTGPADNDWSIFNTLSEQELKLFDFMPADINLNNTSETIIRGNKMILYPNPVSERQSYEIGASDSVVLKMVAVNEHLDVLYKTAIKFRGSKNFQIDYSDRSIFPDRAAFRVYFSFSAINKPNFKAGYGDVKICQQNQGPWPWPDCFD